MRIFLQRLLHATSFVFRKRKSRTIRYAFPVALLAFSLIGASVLTGTNASVLKVVPSKQYVKAGDVFSLDVYAVAAAPVNAINVELEYAKNMISVEGIDIGQSVITIWTEEPYVENNRVILSGGTFRRGFIGEHLLATINVRALETGRATFSTKNVSFFAGDGSGEEVSLDNNGVATIAVTVNDSGSLSGEMAFTLETDINGDGEVTMADILSFMEAWRNQQRMYDFNGDNKMTFRDFGIILAAAFYR